MQRNDLSENKTKALSGLRSAFGKVIMIVFMIALIPVVFVTIQKSHHHIEEELVFTPDHQLRHQKYIKRIPQELTFAGEKVHFKSPEAYQKYYREVKMNTQFNSSTRLLFKNVRDWLPQITQVIKAHNIPEDFKFLAIAESNLSNDISHKGAGGFWQFREMTAIELGLEVNDEVDERFHPIKATKAACKYFEQSYKVFGKWTAVAASYNRGMGGLQRAFESQQVNSYYDLDLNEETSRYIYRVLALKDLINNPEKYGVKTIKRARPGTKAVKVDTTIHDLSQFAGKFNIDYELLQEYNPWLLSNTLTIKEEGKSYTLLIPLNIPPRLTDRKDSTGVIMEPEDYSASVEDDNPGEN